MKKMKKVLVALAALVMFGGTVLPAVTASANTGYSRDYKWNVNHDKYRVKNTKGKTYKMTGSSKNIKLKANHYLKNYKKNKWVRTKFTQIKHHGNWMVYYYVKPITKKKHTGGWVKLTDMKPVKAYKETKDSQADFDTWYRALSQKQRNQYKAYSETGAENGDGEPEQTSLSILAMY